MQSPGHDLVQPPISRPSNTPQEQVQTIALSGVTGDHQDAALPGLPRRPEGVRGVGTPRKDRVGWL